MRRITVAGCRCRPAALIVSGATLHRMSTLIRRRACPSTCAFTELRLTSRVQPVQEAARHTQPKLDEQAAGKNETCVHAAPRLPEPRHLGNETLAFACR